MAAYDPKVDYLKEDPLMSGQNFCVVSFVNPKDKVTQKHLHYVNNFMAADINRTLTAQAVQMAKKLTVDMRSNINTVLDTLKDSLDPEDKHLSSILEERFREMTIDEDKYVTDCQRAYTISQEEITDKYKIYLSENRMSLDDQFDKANDSVTSLRGFKVRGAFNRVDDAKARAKLLRDTVEPAIHTYIVPVGAWFPVDMDADEVQDQDYMLPQLNELMGKYHEGVQARNQHYQERKLEMAMAGTADKAGGTKTTKERLQEKLRAKTSDVADGLESV
jgi:hypothetical protein